MKLSTPLHLQLFVLFAFFTVILTGASSAKAVIDPTVLTSDIDSLTVQGDDLVTTINNTVLAPFTTASQLADIETSMLDYQTNVFAVYDDILASEGTSMSLNDELLISMQSLSNTMAALSQGTMGLSSQLVAIGDASMGASFITMLRLADDIGVMADRILEMADKILVMADNIGLMADRIMETQVIQSNNLELVVDASLQTQRNMITVIQLFAL